jgi:toxin ParE1/3/4
MNHNVNVLIDAEEDLFELYRFLAEKEGVETADRIYKNIKDRCSSLAETPFKGHLPQELIEIGVKDYLEIHYKPYRIIYQVIGDDIYIHCILDGRRDMQTLLQERLLRS